MTRTILLLKVRAAQIAHGATTADLELLKRIACAANPSLLAAVAVFTGIVSYTNSADPNGKTAGPYFPRNSGLILVESKSNLGKGLSGIEHLLDILTIL